jgi:hypothetical protein
MNATSVLTSNYEQRTMNNEPIKTNPILPAAPFGGACPQSVWRNRGKKILLYMTINPRRKALGYYADRRFFAADQGFNLSCFAGLPFGPGLTSSEKKPQVRKIPYKAEACLCRFVYIRKPLYFCQGQWIISADSRLRI